MSVEFGMFAEREIVLGLWSVAGDWGPCDAEEAHALVVGAPGLGVRWVDTAPIYGRGAADRLLARALRELGADAPRVATKVGPRFEGDHPVCDLSPEHVRRDLEASLRRLGVEAVGLVQAHWPCERGTPLRETAEALQALVDEGKAEAWGLCNHGSASLRYGPASMQLPYSMMRRDIEHDGRLRACRHHGVPVLAYETLARGLLGGAYRTLPRLAPTDHRRRDPRFWGARFFHVAQRVALLRQASERWGVPVAALASGWVLARPGVRGVLVGARRLEQLRESVQARRVAGEPPWLATLDRIAASFGASAQASR